MKSAVNFSIGYNDSFKSFCNLIEKYKDHIESIYFPLPKKYIGSGRGSKKNDSYEAEIFGLINFCNSFNIKPILLLNPNILDYSKIPVILNYLKTIDLKLGVQNIILKDPFLLKKIKTQFPHINIEISILAHVNTLEKARQFKALGASTITIDREHTRDLDFIRKIHKILRVKIMLNEGCMKNGIFCDVHYNVLSGELNCKYPIQESDFRLIERAPCLNFLRNEPEKIFSATFVRPEDLKHYVNIADSFKLSTRNGSTRIIENILHAYVHQSYEGNLLDLLNSPFTQVVNFIDNKALDTVDFFNTLSTCDDDCGNCGFCRKLLTQTGDIGKVIHALDDLIAEHPDEMMYVFRRTHLKKICGDEAGFLEDQK